MPMMRRLALPFSVVLVLAAVAAHVCGAEGSPGGGGHVVVITIDGLPGTVFDDPKAPIPTLRGLAARGTFATEGMRVVNPTVTWPNHTTLVTGVRADKHGVLFNGVLVRPGGGKPVRVDGARDQAELVAVPTVFDLLHKAGRRTAAINWPCTRNSPS